MLSGHAVDINWSTRDVDAARMGPERDANEMEGSYKLFSNIDKSLRINTVHIAEKNSDNSYFSTFEILSCLTPTTAAVITVRSSDSRVLYRKVSSAISVCYAQSLARSLGCFTHRVFV